MDPNYSVGDVVTRDGTDRQVVTFADADIIGVKCIKAPATEWCAVGEMDYNLARRYQMADDSNA